MNLLLERSKFVDYYTYLDPIFQAAPELADFTYLISDLEIGGGCERLAKGPLVLSGIELQAIVENEQVQFIWAVLSAFDREPAIPAELPYADGNQALWKGSPKPQISDAKFEIVCWDSASTLFIGVEASTAAKLQQKYPDIQDLDEYNQNQRLTSRYRQ
jgi:hypothetical protein